MECCLKKINAKIEDFTKHRNSMLLVGGVTAYDFEAHTIEAFAHIGENNIFYEKDIGGAYSFVGFELAAQAVSVYIGLETKTVFHSEPEMGFILNLADMQCCEPVLRSGTPAVIRARQTHRDANIAYFDAEVVQGELKIMTVSFMAMLAAS